MGIKCEIHLFKHTDIAYKPGSTVRGVVKYVLSEGTLFNRITVSLKGLGKLELTQMVYNGKTYIVNAHHSKESYVDIDEIVLDDTKKVVVEAGVHEIPFTFILPEKVPPTFKFNKNVSGLQVECKIFYYIRAKFEKPGFLNFDKRFKTELKVSSVIDPTLPSPATYEFEKKPFHVFWKNDRTVKISGTLENSVTHPGGNVQISYEVNNATNLEVKGVKIKLSQETTFYAGKTFSDPTDAVKLTDWKATPIKSGDTQAMTLIINIPPDVTSVHHTKLFSRDYYICVVAELPMPHRNAVLKLPIEIIENELDDDANTINYDLPPSYSEAMEECKKDDLD